MNPQTKFRTQLHRLCGTDADGLGVVRTVDEINESGLEIDSEEFRKAILAADASHGIGRQ